MPQLGKYDPTNPENTSALFAFQEIPLTSVKLNRWNGNVAAGLGLLHQVCSLLLAQGRSAVLSVEDDQALKVAALDPPGMAVRVRPGWAVVEGCLAGVSAAAVAPSGYELAAPAMHPRIDLVVLTSRGELEVVSGAEQEEPVPPACPEEALPLAHIRHRVGAAAVREEDNGEDSFLLDARPRFLVGEAHRHAEDTSPIDQPNGMRCRFPVQNRFRSGTLDVFCNGVLQEKDVDYAEDEDRGGYTFFAAPHFSDRLQHRYIVDVKPIEEKEKQ